MSASLADALAEALTEALPGLLGGRRPPLAIEVRSEALEYDPSSLDAAAGVPRPEDQLDLLPFDPAASAGPYELTRTPDRGPRVVRLVGDGRREAVAAAEIDWDAGEPRRFVLALQPGRSLDGLTAVQIRYGVTAVFTTLQATETLQVTLTPATDDAHVPAAAELLVAAVLALDRDKLTRRLESEHADGDYSARVRATQLRLERGAPLAETGRAITVTADLEIRVTRALREGEAAPIERVDLATKVEA